MTAALPLRLSIVQVLPETRLQPDHPPNVPPTGVAVRVTSVPVGKLALHVLWALEQLRPSGELVIVPEPLPAKVTVMLGSANPPPPVVPVKQVTFAVI